MAYCINCGQQLPEGAKFCVNCGTPAGGTKEAAKSKAVDNATEKHNFGGRKNCKELIKLDAPIDLRYKYKITLLGNRKKVETSPLEQKKLKNAFVKIFPDNMFIDELNESNSINAGEKRRRANDGRLDEALYSEYLAEEIFDGRGNFYFGDISDDGDDSDD